jgi:hypothetical protein
MAIQLKEYQSVSGRIRLQFVDLLGHGARGVEEFVWETSREDYLEVLKSYGAKSRELGESQTFVDYWWDKNELKLARKYKNTFNKLARTKKLSKNLAVEILTKY